MQRVLVLAAAFCAAVTFLSGFPGLTGAGQAGTRAPESAAAGDRPSRIRASSAYLFDLDANRALWARNGTSRRPIGSIVKVMSALVVIRTGNLDRKIRIKQSHLAYAAAHHGSTAGLHPGDRIPARELLYALLLPSGSDAAVALAEAYGPGRRGFVRKMNRMAAGFGMRGTHYANFDGLPYPNPYAGYSTAGDLITLARHALLDPTFRTIVASRRHVLEGGRHRHGRYVWRTTNELLGDYPGMLGIKSGHTTAAGYCLLFAARRYGRTLIGVVLNSSRTNRAARFTDAVTLLEWGFGFG